LERGVAAIPPIKIFPRPDPVSIPFTRVLVMTIEGGSYVHQRAMVKVWIVVSVAVSVVLYQLIKVAPAG